MSHLTPYRRLALAILKQAVRDAEAGYAEARRFLEEPGERLSLWCGLLALQEESARHLLARSGRGYLAKVNQLVASGPPPA